MSRKSHCSSDTQFQPALTWLVVRDKYSVHARSHALAHYMQPSAFFIFAEKYRCENGWSTAPRFISFPPRAFWSMILWRKRPERKDEVHEFPVWNVHEAHGRSTAVGRNAPSRTQTIIDRFPNYCLGTSNGAWPVAKGRAIASFPYFPYGRVEKRQWEDGQEGEERRLWQSERLVECFLTKGIFEAAKTSHQRKQILLGVERKLSVAQSLRCYA